MTHAPATSTHPVIRERRHTSPPSDPLARQALEDPLQQVASGRRGGAAARVARPGSMSAPPGGDALLPMGSVDNSELPPWLLGASAAVGIGATASAEVDSSPLAQRGTGPADSSRATTSPAAAAIQRKGDTPLAASVPAEARAQGPHTAELTPLLDQVAAYDASQDGRPEFQLQALDGILTGLRAIISARPQPSWLGGLFRRPPPTPAERLLAVVSREREIVAAQDARLTRLTRTEDGPYAQMTEEGLLWSHPEYANNTSQAKESGRAYFARMSDLNRKEMGVEACSPREEGARSPAEAEWFAPFMERARVALQSARVNHYTTSVRARMMLPGGQLKSKTVLERDSAAFRHNTSAYDDAGLGNSGFVFFFIEAEDAPLRATRFADGDEGSTAVRISIPILESGLLTHGWIMLSDFAQREYPDLNTNAESEATASWLPTRAADGQARHPRMTQPVRRFHPGMGLLEAEDFEEAAKLPTLAQRAAASLVTPQVRGDPQSRQVYTGPVGRLQVPDRIHNNILVGGDIIDGLAMRAALEVSRIQHVNPELASTLTGLDGARLMSFMLKDLFRPQAMIPNSVAIRPAHIQPALPDPD